MRSAAQQQEFAAVAEGQAGFLCVQVHAVHVRRAAQRQHIGAVLVELEEVRAVLVEERKVRGDDDLVRGDAPTVGHHGTAVPRKRGGALEDVQPFGNCRGEFEWMELRLMGQPQRTGDGEGKRQLVLEGRVQPGARHGGPFPLERCTVGFVIDEGILLLESAVDLPAQPAVPPERGLVGLAIELRRLHAERADQPVVDQPVLAGDLGRRARGDAVHDPVRLDERAGHAGFRERVRAQQAAQSAADDQHVGLQIAAQRGEGRQLCRRQPKRIHEASPEYRMHSSEPNMKPAGRKRTEER